MPGVDHAVTIGTRYQSENAMPGMAMPKQVARIQELMCAGVPPAAVAAWKIKTEVLAKPTSTATKPAEMLGM